ncbi:protein FAM200A-like [Diabrotica virgifera virgifera]|uniref:HAT C-terminal dimerisation domain-containing protein n=1 Tax=Diabrotica virgifera virgifera TaxID=50390 RepID=A0ABM5L1P2_DIAVI|nr:protein FAM200A-like [Diabrotica virgifera virgifera]
MDMFPLLQNEGDEDKEQEIRHIVTEHLSLLEEIIARYFPSLNEKNMTFSTGNTANFQFSLNQEGEFISLSSDRTLKITLKIKFSEVNVQEFWILVQEEYPLLAKKAISILIQFSTSYLCEFGFSSLTIIKNKKRERLLNLEQETRVALSHIRPDIEQICKRHQAQVSH